MADAILLCTDGSELALDALQRSLRVLAPSDHVVIATVVELTAAIDVVGTGMASGLTSPEEAERDDQRTRAAGEEVVTQARDALGLPAAEVRVLDGTPGPALVALADEIGASVIVIGSRGHGGLRRAVLGSVSDHVVRNASCPVVVCSPEE